MSSVALDPRLVLAEEIGQLTRDPVAYCKYAFPWGEKGTALEAYSGPDTWQYDILDRIGQAVRERNFDRSNPKAVDPVLAAVRSGHGVGKGALTGMITAWILDTRPFSRGILACNTSKQLDTKTFPEVAKWRRLAITAEWFEILHGHHCIRHKSFRDSWRIDGIPWDAKNTESFAGQHAAGSSSFLILDECSAIPKALLEVGLGAMTDGEPFMLCLGNPTRNSGFFYEIFTRGFNWIKSEVDSRTARMPNKRLLAAWIEEYGLHSDFVRVRVLGKEPAAGERQMIPSRLVQDALLRDLPEVSDEEPFILGVDVARFGDDESVICPRRGDDARSFPWVCRRAVDTMQLAGDVADIADSYERRGLIVDAICVDGGGLGAGVVDRLMHLGYPVEDVNFGSKPTAPRRFKDRGAEMWGRMKAWVERGALPDDTQLERQLTGREYGWTDDQRLYLESKDDLKERGEASPDRADALALTFASIVARRNKIAQAHDRQQRGNADWDPYAA